MAFDTKEELDDYAKNNPNATCKGLPTAELVVFIKANKGKYLFLKEADLRCANLYRANLCGAEYNDNTIFPEGFTIPKEMIKI
jgi:hypothetical protein